VLMVGQYFLERHFGRGFGTNAPREPRPARPAGAGGV
jgi:polar amino acid transport system permease protein